MGMTMTQKILARAAGVDSCRAGELLMCKLNLVLGNDITSPVAIREFDKEGFTGVFDKSKISMVMDHFTPNKDIKAATLAKQMREFARAQHIVHYYEVGRVGIEHALLPEKGIAYMDITYGTKTIPLVQLAALTCAAATHEELEVGGVYYGEMRRVNGQSVNQSVLHDVTPLYHLQGLVGGIHGNKDTAEMVYNQLVWMSQNKAEQ